MLQVNSLSKSFGPQTLFENVTLQLNPGCRYGLVGANGAGKTTLLKILTGDESSSSGEVVVPKGVRLGVLKQDRFQSDSERIIDVAMRGDERVFAALSEHDRLVGDAAPDAVRLSELSEVVAMYDGYTLEARASAVLRSEGA